MRLTLSVQAEGRFTDAGYNIEIEDVFRECFEPLNTCDDAIIGVATGDVMAGSVQMIRKVKLREDASKYLAKHIAEMLIKQMKKADKHNGY